MQAKTEVALSSLPFQQFERSFRFWRVQIAVQVLPSNQFIEQNKTVELVGEKRR